MTRALVLGGGGPVGVGWESGLAVGLALQMDLPALVSSVSQPLAIGSGAAGATGELMSAWADAVARALTPEALRVELGKLALAAQTVDEGTFVGAEVFAQLEGREWPASFRCTAVDTHTGALQVWDQSSGVPLPRGVASSCSVPGVFPPVTLGAGRYMDGGMRTPLNADLAAGHDAVIV